MKRVLSGIKPSGDVTLGNYLGAMKRWAEQSTDSSTEHFYFIANLHALTVRQDPEKLRKSTLEAAAWLIAMGVDPKKSALYVQSRIPAHSEVSWILENYVTMGELSRMTQFKDRSKKSGQEGQLVGLYTYPALMAADILLYDADEVPVGEDQVQHVELARNIAQRFNNLYGETFNLPKATLPEVGLRIMNLQDPTAKMSKSDTDDSGNILLSDTTDLISKKVMRAVTDSGSEVTLSDDKPAIKNLLQIFSLLANKPISVIEEQYSGKGYADFKKDLAELMVECLAPIQKSFEEIIADSKQLEAILEQGNQKAAKIADKKTLEVRKKLGLL